MSGGKKRNPQPLILIILLLPALGFTGWKAWTMLHQGREEERAFQKLAAIVAEEEKGNSQQRNSGNQEELADHLRDSFPVSSSTPQDDSSPAFSLTTQDSSTVSPLMPWDSRTVPQATESAEIDSGDGRFMDSQNIPVEQGQGLAPETENTDPESPERQDAAPARQILPQYQKLHEMNPDFFGWLRIEGTIIDYPVMYTPEDPEFYLRRGFDREDAYSGTPFLEGNCDPEGNYYIIYAHHMRDESMFHHLPDYAREDYWREHPVIQLDTLYEKREYEVIAAFRSQVYEENRKGVFKYYEYTDLRDPEIFEEYMAGVRSLALYDTGLSATSGDDILALSTCNYHTANGRFVVVARRIRKQNEE